MESHLFLSFDLVEVVVDGSLHWDEYNRLEGEDDEQEKNGELEEVDGQVGVDGQVEVGEQLEVDGDDGNLQKELTLKQVVHHDNVDYHLTQQVIHILLC